MKHLTIATLLFATLSTVAGCGANPPVTRAWHADHMEPGASPARQDGVRASPGRPEHVREIDGPNTRHG